MPVTAVGVVPEKELTGKQLVSRYTLWHNEIITVLCYSCCYCYCYCYCYLTKEQMRRLLSVRANESSLSPFSLSQLSYPIVTHYPSFALSPLLTNWSIYLLWNLKECSSIIWSHGCLNKMKSSALDMLQTKKSSHLFSELSPKVTCSRTSTWRKFFFLLMTIYVYLYVQRPLYFLSDVIKLVR